MTKGNCRFCNELLQINFVDLGLSPLSNSFLKKQDLEKKENIYPLHAYICEKCLLVQLDEFEKPEKIFSEYVYFSSYSRTWLKHAKNYTELMISKLNFSEKCVVFRHFYNIRFLSVYQFGK